MAEWVLGIETSCDETSAAVLRRNGAGVELAGLSILSQDVHRIFGGVVPELASRAHVQALGSVIDRALADAGIGLAQLDGIAVTAGPGLVGALLVGVMHGKTLAYSLDRPLIGVNHLEGHLFAPTLEDPELAPPFVGLLVSGGHTMLLDVPAWGEYRLLGQTLDDAAGEAFDKTAKLLGLGYPGGAPIERLAREGRPGRHRFPRPMLQELDRDGPNRYAFSFSGLKTAVLRVVRPVPGGQPLALGDAEKADIAWAFQDAATDVLTAKTAHAVEALGYSAAMVGGGVACNGALVARLRERLAGRARVSVASPRLNTDNAAMIAAAGAWRLARGERSGLDLEPRDDLPLPGLIAPTPVSGSDA
jgi:N6-L-threonylcarbamoyladenine synthase